MEFEWDSSKAKSNLRKHKVSFPEAAESFADPLGFTMSDEKHFSRRRAFTGLVNLRQGKF